MKSIMILASMAASLLLTGCSGKIGSGIGMVEQTKTEVASAQVVTYARTDRSTATNIFLTVTEIWKGSEQASRLGITNGMQFSENWNHSDGSLPEAAIILLSVDTNRQTSSEEIIWVSDGQVEHMTVRDFKAKIGL